MTKSAIEQKAKRKLNFDENREILADFAEIKEIYEDFKRLRKILGKPVTDKLDPIKIKKDLSGRDFFC